MFCFCVVLWDLSICVNPNPINNRLALRKSPEIEYRSTKLDYSGLYIFWSVVFPFLSLLTNITAQLHTENLQTHKCNKVHAHTNSKSYLKGNNSRYTICGDMEYRTATTAPIKKYLCALLLFPTMQCLSPSLHGCTGSSKLTGSEQHPRSLVPHTSNKGLKAQKGLLIKYGWG